MCLEGSNPSLSATLLSICMDKKEYKKRRNELFKEWKPKKVSDLLGDRYLHDLSFNELLEIVDALFPTYNPKTNVAEATCYNYSISRMPYGWVFNVVNSWQKWSGKGFDHRFGTYTSIEGCIIAFLNYVSWHDIQPHKLYEK